MSERDTRILRAGGLLPPGAATAGGEAGDEVGARAYRHPALKDRVVVRLTAQALAVGDDLEMEVLGFGAPEDRGVVGVMRRRALGFPGWALVHDPEHARFALEVVKEFKQHIRRARSKPGNAKEGIDDIGKRLGRSVPHFLPAFYEQAGRNLIEAGALNYAAQYFEKAREAERVHALAIDEDRRRDAFLEFALAGAVSIKSISSYARELEKSVSPGDAYRHYRRLAVQRTLGGMPPWSSMPKELARLAKAAKLDPDDEAQKIIADVAESPSLARAAGEFWRAYRRPIVELAKNTPTVRTSLANLFPTPNDAEFDDTWFEMLEECGAIDDLADGSAKPGTAAHWLVRMIQHVSRGWKERAPAVRIFLVIERLAERLKRDDVPVAIADRYSRIDLDILDAALALGIPVAPPERHSRIDLLAWARLAKSERRGRDPQHAADDPRFHEVLFRALDQAMGKDPFEGASRGKKGFHSAKDAWLGRAHAGAIEGALPSLSEAAGRFEFSTTPHTFSEFPEHFERIVAIDVAPILARNLRGGLIDELVWAPFEEAHASLLRDPSNPPRLFGAFPYAVLSDSVRAIVVGPKGIEAKIDLALPKGAMIARMRWVQERLLVIFRDPSWKWFGYWSGAESDIFELEPSHYGGEGSGLSVVLSDGSVTEGGRALSARDRRHPELGVVVSDGVTYWNREWSGPEWKLREYDPRTGEKGRTSLPQFFEEFAEPGKMLLLLESTLLPVPDGARGSPLGAKDGLTGWRARTKKIEASAWAREIASTHRESESIDGRRFEGLVRGGAAIALLRIPGDEAGRPLGPGLYSAATLPVMHEPKGSYPISQVNDRAYIGSFMPPMCYLHFQSARDERGSRALRSTTEAQARTLLERAVEERRTEQIDERKATLPATADALKRAIPEIVDPRLAQAVIGLVRRGAELVEAIERIRTTRSPTLASSSTSVEHVNDLEAGARLQGLFGHGHYQAAGSFTKQFTELSNLISIGDASESAEAMLAPTSIPWTTIAGRFGALAFWGSSPIRTAEDRDLAARAIDLWSRTIFVEKSKLLRIMTVAAASLPGAKQTYQHRALFTHGGNQYFGIRFWAQGTTQAYFTVLEHAPSGEFKLFPGADLKSERGLGSSRDNVERLRALARLLREKGAVEWPKEAIEALASRTGLTRPEAVLLVAGFPNVDAYSSNFLEKEARETLGLKTTEASAGRGTLRAIPVTVRAELLDAAVPDDPERLWTPLGTGVEDETSTVARLARAWVERFGKRTAVPDELVAACDKEIGGPLKAATFLGALAQPSSAEMFTSDDPDAGKLQGLVGYRQPKSDVRAFSVEVVLALASYLPHLFGSLPVGDPIRSNLPEALDRARARLEATSLILPLAARYFYEEGWESAMEGYLDMLGGEPLGGGIEGRDTGAIVALKQSRAVSVYFRPALLIESGRWDEAERVRATSLSMDPAFPCVRLLLSPGFNAISARIRSTPVPPGQFESNPVHSVPAILEGVRRKLDLSEDAGILYLQTLTLIHPTSKAIQRANDWKSARYSNAAKELVARKLVLEAKRERAGRSHFLPGAWEAAKAPHLPFEGWKLPLYEISRNPQGGLQSPLARHVPLRPLHELFEMAWARIEGGDVPRYEEVSG